MKRENIIKLEEAFTGEEGNFPNLMRSYLRHYFRSHKGVLPRGLYKNILSEVEKALFEETLRVVNGNKNQAAEILGIHRNTLRYKIEQLGLDKVVS